MIKKLNNEIAIKIINGKIGGRANVFFLIVATLLVTIPNSLIETMNKAKYD